MPDTTSTAPVRIVMLVDDDKFLLDMYSMKFTQAGYAVRAHLGAKSALEDLRGGAQPDAILFDLSMPEIDGFGFLQAIREGNLATSARKIALTNQSDDAEQKQARDLGADEYIIKASVIPSEVVAKVGELLAK